MAAPIVVEGRRWGAIAVRTLRDEPLSRGTESRLGQFTELMATANGNIESRAEVERLAEEQVALRRVATLVAAGGAPDEIFAAVGDEVRQLVGNDLTSMFRCEPGDMLTLVAVRVRAEGVPDGLVGARIPMRPQFAEWLRAGLAVRLDARRTAKWMVDLPAAERLGLKSAIGAPIIVEGRPWGAIFVCDQKVDGLPPAAERPFVQFTELVATAIANAQARADLERLAEEQAALRRVATLVAEGALPSAVLDAVAAEMEALLEADQVALNRFEAGDELLVLAHRGLDVARTPVGSRVRIRGASATAIVRETARPARMEGYESAGGELAELAWATGLRSSVSAPITVERKLWGLITASWKREEPPPPDTEERMVKFTELVATAIANAESREQLAASRARVVRAGDQARRRIQRDLHDGAQQRFVHTIITLKVARSALAGVKGEGPELVDEALENAERANEELRELASGIHPSILTSGGLGPALRTLARRSPIPVTLDLRTDGRLPGPVEVTAYFVVSEALANAAKHSNASSVEVTLDTADGHMRFSISDDGVGGADPTRGSGLVGLKDRVAAVGGTLTFHSAPGQGTRLLVELPVNADSPTSSNSRDS